MKNRLLIFSLLMLISRLAISQANSHTNSEPQLKAPLDSVEYRGTVTGNETVFLNGNAFCMRSVTVNNMPVTDLYPYPVKIDFRKMHLKRGDKATIKVIFTNGAKVTMLPGGGLDITKK